jgi:multisubunit Na+/H+ antiporter MnhE subunit
MDLHSSWRIAIAATLGGDLEYSLLANSMALQPGRCQGEVGLSVLLN